MIEDSFRILAIIIMFIVMLLDKIPFSNMFKNSVMQIYLAVFCIFILMVFDNITGFILTLSLLIIYFRVYTIEMKKIENMKEQKDVDKEPQPVDKKVCTSGKCSLEVDAQHEQSNIAKKANKVNNFAIDPSGFQPYITQEHLIAAQTNIFDGNVFFNEVGNISNEYNFARPLYKAQGLNNDNLHLEGYDYNNSYSGDMECYTLNKLSF